MYFVFIKVPGKVSSMTSDGVPTAADYDVPEGYLNYTYDPELYNEIHNQSCNGFATADEAKAWIDVAIKKIYKFIHSTPKVRKQYTKAYVKIVSSDTKIENDYKHRTVADVYPNIYGRYKPEKGSDIHYTYDLSDFVFNLDRGEIEKTKELYASRLKTQVPAFVKVFNKSNFHKHVGVRKFIKLEPWSNYEDDAKSAPDNVSGYPTLDEIKDIGLADKYFFLRQVGPWLEVQCYKLKLRSYKVGRQSIELFKYYDYDCNDTDDVLDGGFKRYLSSKYTFEDIVKELGVNIIDLRYTQPYYIPALYTLIDSCYCYTEAHIMYRCLKTLGIIQPNPKYEKPAKSKKSK